MKKVALFFLVVLLAQSLFSQKTSYQFPEKFDQNYNFHPKEAFEVLNKKPIGGLTPEQSTNFRIHYIYNVQKEFDNNEIYLGWNMVEDYLYQVFDTIIQKSERKILPFSIFVTRDVDPNAHAMDNGLLFINVGLLATLRDEASLAKVIGHECGHATLKHGFDRYYTNIAAHSTQTTSYDAILNLYAKSRKSETAADTFAFRRIARAGYDLNAISGVFEIFEAENTAGMHKAFSSYSLGKEKRYKEYMQLFSTHPSNMERKAVLNKFKQGLSSGGKKFVVDSTLFCKIRKTAREECKKILFEQAAYKECLNLAFIDYLYDGKNLKNLYYLMECTRRVMYNEPKLATRGFLADEYSDKEFIENNFSILKKPDYIFLDSIQEAELIGHPFFSEPVKPFNTYSEAFLFFSDKALAAGFNEANFSKALFYYFKKEPETFTKYLTDYLAKGGLNSEFAQLLIENNGPKAPGKKTICVFDNTTVYHKSDLGYMSNNYYLSKQKIKFNEEVKKALVRDPDTQVCYFINELQGSEPLKLHDVRKVTDNIRNLYSDSDTELYRKKRVRSRETMEEQQLSQKYNKHLLLFAPELYIWMKENDVRNIDYTTITYEHPDALNENEFHNNYLSCYLDMNALRPYFKIGVRTATTRKQSTPDMAKDIAEFMYDSE